MTASDKAQLRTINALMKEIEIIEVACNGKKGRSNANGALDEFQIAKLDLNEKISHLKQDVKTRAGIEERLGTNSESIKLKTKIKSDLADAQVLQRKMEDAYNENMRDFENGTSELTSEQLNQRKELLELMKQDLEYTSNEFSPKKESVGGGGFQLAQQAREKRRKRKEQGLGSAEPQPLTAKQQAFIQESIERDQVLDEKLEIIKQGVMQLNAIGSDINQELDKQAVMLEEVEQKMDAVTDKLENRNEQIKKLLETSGGATRWCPVLILCVILMACIGYIYNAFIG